MRNLGWFGRLGWHGSKFVWRVLAILMPMVIGALWSVSKLLAADGEKSLADGKFQNWLGEDPEELINQKMYPGGVPWPEHAEHYGWEGHYGDYVNEKWR